MCDFLPLIALNIRSSDSTCAVFPERILSSCPLWLVILWKYFPKNFLLPILGFCHVFLHNNACLVLSKMACRMLLGVRCDSRAYSRCCNSANVLSAYICFLLRNFSASGEMRRATSCSLLSQHLHGL